MQTNKPKKKPTGIFANVTSEKVKVLPRVKILGKIQG